MVEPIAQRLGADLAIGTQVAVVDGKYTGEIIFYAYGEGKAEAVHSLAIDHGFDLAECFAYSDSHTDLPMLEAVGNPRAVNPDSELRAIATERGWEVLDFAKPVSMKAKVEKRQAIAAGAGVALSAAHCHQHAVFEHVGRVTATDHSWNAQLARNDGSVAGAAAPVGDDGAGALHHRFPVRVGHVGDQHVTCLHLVHVFQAEDNAH